MNEPEHQQYSDAIAALTAIFRETHGTDKLSLRSQKLMQKALDPALAAMDASDLGNPTSSPC